MKKVLILIAVAMAFVCVNMDVVYAEKRVYNFSDSMPSVYKRINTDMLNMSEYYMSQITNAPYMDHIWPLAVSCVEYNYYSKTTKDRNLITTWVMDVEKYESNPRYLMEFDWHEVNRIDPELVTKRAGGAIGIFQCEKGFGSWAKPIRQQDMGMIGSKDGGRQDCWLTLGANPSGGTNIRWERGVVADRWSYMDSLNMMAGVLQADFKWMAGNMVFDELPNRYAKATMLMWGHNRGNGIFREQSTKEEVLKIVSKIPELQEKIIEDKPAKFYYQGYIDNIINKYGLAPYPTRALAAYLIIEHRINGEW